MRSVYNLEVLRTSDRYIIASGDRTICGHHFSMNDLRVLGIIGFGDDLLECHNVPLTDGNDYAFIIDDIEMNNHIRSEIVRSSL